MDEDIIEKMKNRLFWSDAEEAITEIHLLRQMVQDWKQTAEMLAMDLGKVEYAQAVYEDVSEGLYEKVRERIKSSE